MWACMVVCLYIKKQQYHPYWSLSHWESQLWRHSDSSGLQSLCGQNKCFRHWGTILPAHFSAPCWQLNGFRQTLLAEMADCIPSNLWCTYFIAVSCQLCLIIDLKVLDSISGCLLVQFPLSDSPERYIWQNMAFICLPDKISGHFFYL